MLDSNWPAVSPSIGPFNIHRPSSPFNQFFILPHFSISFLYYDRTSTCSVNPIPVNYNQLVAEINYFNLKKKNKLPATEYWPADVAIFDFSSLSVSSLYLRLFPATDATTIQFISIKMNCFIKKKRITMSVSSTVCIWSMVEIVRAHLVYKTDLQMIEQHYFFKTNPSS